MLNKILNRLLVKEPTQVKLSPLEELDDRFPDMEFFVTLADRETATALSMGVAYAYGADVIGDIVEFGTMSGFTARVLATSMKASENKYNLKKRSLYLFDSFEGLPEIESSVDLASPHVQSGAWSKGGCKVLSEVELRKVCSTIIENDRIFTYNGWFSDTVKNIPKSMRFSLIHFDGDLYQSTIDALDTCFSGHHVSDGAMICFDDWHCNRSDPNLGEQKAWHELCEKYEILFSDMGPYSWHGHRFIIQSYKRTLATNP